MKAIEQYFHVVLSCGTVFENQTKIGSAFQLKMFPSADSPFEKITL